MGRQVLSSSDKYRIGKADMLQAPIRFTLLNDEISYGLNICWIYTSHKYGAL